MQDLNVVFDPVRGFLLQIGAYLPRLAIALGVLVIGWLLAKAARFSVVKALRALNFHVISERAGEADIPMQKAGDIQKPSAHPLMKIGAQYGTGLLAFVALLIIAREAFFVATYNNLTKVRLHPAFKHQTRR